VLDAGDPAASDVAEECVRMAAGDAGVAADDLGVRTRGDALPACDESALATSLEAGASVENVGLPPAATDGAPDGTESAPDHALSDPDEDLGR
jgi:hypothetical protein